ncbi:MAG: hypothetical protein AAGJ81_11185 [Verrucomicrobiota bacterium]
MRFLFTGLFLLPLGLFLGCSEGDQDIRVYQLTKPSNQPEPPSDQAPVSPPVNAPFAPPAARGPSVNPSSSMNVLPGMEEAAAAFETPDWRVPVAWESLPPTQIRKGNFRIVNGSDTVEVTVTAFPGDVGGTEANVNRWRRQIGLSPLPLGILEGQMEEIRIDGAPAILVKLSDPGAPAAMGILGAIIPRGENTWFVKMVGNNRLVTAQELNLRSFLNSIKF